MDTQPYMYPISACEIGLLLVLKQEMRYPPFRMYKSVYLEPAGDFLLLVTILAGVRKNGMLTPDLNATRDSGER